MDLFYFPDETVWLLYEPEMYIVSEAAAGWGGGGGVSGWGGWWLSD